MDIPVFNPLAQSLGIAIARAAFRTKAVRRNGRAYGPAARMDKYTCPL
ncbi:hypothetical protein BRO54_2544 [Geobacillus proteiniphilus]|uniref:Uncharacterized protein n=1 Tax=Geobacillus proteiniphilus TaxID=860353 RepID=A0A1Q5SVC0_9BACL|nr:hypothetical protein BRO54_2544 [Geobacillus proteiniphilus]